MVPNVSLSVGSGGAEPSDAPLGLVKGGELLEVGVADLLADELGHAVAFFHLEWGVSVVEHDDA